MAKNRDHKRTARAVQAAMPGKRRGKNWRRMGAYIGAAREVRDHLGNVVVSEDDVQNARAQRLSMARALGVTDQTGVGFRV